MIHSQDKSVTFNVLIGFKSTKHKVAANQTLRINVQFVFKLYH